MVRLTHSASKCSTFQGQAAAAERLAPAGDSAPAKPDNVMLVADSAVPGGVRAKLLDFGIAKLRGERDSPSSQTQTKTGALMGTPVYMSPEQCRGAGGVAERTDVYSLGIMMYQMLSGSTPFQAAGTGELMSQHMYSEPPPLKARAPQVSDETAVLIAAMLIKDPEARPTMEEVEAELVRLSGVPIGNAVTGGHPVQKMGMGAPLGQIVVGGSMVDPFSSTMGGAPSTAPSLGTGQIPVVGAGAGATSQMPILGTTATGQMPILGTGPYRRTGTHTPVVVGASEGSHAPPPGRMLWRLLGSGAVVAVLTTGLMVVLSQRAGARAEQLLSQARGELREHRWAAAEGHAAEVLSLESLDPSQREAALELKARSEREHRAQTVFEAMRAAEQSGRGEEALRLYQQLPSDSALVASAQEIFARAAPRVLTAATAQIEAAQREGRCDDVRREAEQLAQLLPSQPEVQQLVARPCQAQASSEKAQRTQAEARALLTKLTDAYNQGQPEALQLLYGERVLGVHRQGERVMFADRLQWIGEQTARLQHPGMLLVTGTRVAATSTAARVFFNYLLESGGPEQERESGRAELFLLREPAGLRIARQEWWPERPLGQAHAAAPTRSPDQFAFVEAMDLLLPTQVEPSWTQGALVVESAGDQVRVSRSIEPAQLPAEIVRWQGRRVQLYDLSGKRCEARVVGFKVVGRLRPHPELQRHWQTESAQTVAREAWELTSGDHVLAAGLEGDHVTCQGASWARAVELTDPKLELMHDAPPQLRQAALEELRKLPAYAQIQAALARELTPPGRSGAGSRSRSRSGRSAAPPPSASAASWDQGKDAHVEVSVLMIHGVQLVSVSARAGLGCIGLSHQLWALWQLQGDPSQPEWHLLSSPRSGQGGAPRAVLDLDGDGIPELLFVPAGMGELLGIVRSRGGTGANSGTNGLGDGGTYDDFQLNRLPVLDSSC